MAPMIRKQIYLEVHQETQLKARAKANGVSEAELIREAIDKLLNAPVTVPTDLSAWEEAKTFIKERMAMNVPQTGRQWTRDELYDERLKRFAD